MRERREISTRADGATARNVREEAAVQTLDQKLHRLRPGAGVALRERVRTEQHRCPHDLVGIRLADPTGVAPKQAELELRCQLLRDRLRDEASEAGVDPVGVLCRPVSRPLDELACPHDLLARTIAELDRHAADCNRPNVVDRQVVAA
jgi:hypothetical protein